MTANIEYLIPRAAVVQYDGSNWSDLLTVLTVDPNADLTLVSEIDGVATFTYFDGAGVQTATIEAGDFISAGPGRNWPTLTSPASLDGWVKMSDLL